MDLGNYTCQASNNLGKDRGSLTLSGIPTVCYFDSVGKREEKSSLKHALSDHVENGKEIFILFSFLFLFFSKLKTNICRRQSVTIETDTTSHGTFRAIHRYVNIDYSIANKRQSPTC
jgi:hypothetical protein